MGETHRAKNCYTQEYTMVTEQYYVNQSLNIPLISTNEERHFVSGKNAARVFPLLFCTIVQFP